MDEIKHETEVMEGTIDRDAEQAAALAPVAKSSESLSLGDLKEIAGVYPLQKYKGNRARSNPGGTFNIERDCPVCHKPMQVPPGTRMLSHGGECRKKLKVWRRRQGV